MTYLKLAKILIFAMPEILRLIKTIDAKYDEAALTDKIKHDLGAINEAFEKRDGAALTRLFNS
jgi:hypothetical protein